MKCLLSLCLFVALPFGLVPVSVAAQNPSEPLVELDLNETEVVPGQPALLRVTVLVPTWLSKPVEFPTFEAPDLMVKLLEGSTNPTSRSVGGETWSGVSRAYRLSPMVPGTITIPEQELRFLWAEPGQSDPNISVVVVDPIRITGITPQRAQDLDPFIAANALTLTQEITTEDRILKPGDSLTRTIIVDIEGTSPLFVPTLLPPHSIQGIASYPSEPELRETANQNWISGSRRESTTLVAESGGTGAVPPVELRWYNLQSGDIEMSRIDGFEITVDAPVARDRPNVDVRAIATLAVMIAAAGLAGYLGHHFLVPPIRRGVARRRAAKLASEGWAYERLRRAIRQKDFDEVGRTIALWASRMQGSDPRSDPAVGTTLTELGRCLYGPAPADPSAAWADLNRAIVQARRRAMREGHVKARRALAPLNPA